MLRISVSRQTLLLVFCILAVSPCTAGDKSKIILLMSGDTQVYQTVAKDTINEIKKKCKNATLPCSTILFENFIAGESSSLPIDNVNMLIAFGTKAANDNLVSDFKHQTIISMIPRQSEIGQNDNFNSDRVIRIFIDQPFERFLALTKAVMPRATRIGLLLYRPSDEQRKSFEETALNSGFELAIGEVDSNDDIGESLSHLVNNIDVLIALPDSRIHNSNTISNILTTSYRNHIPVIGFSSAYVKAGATAAVYTSLNDISKQVSDEAVQILLNGTPGENNLSASYFSISFNFDVARSLGIAITSPSDIKEIIMRGLSK